MLHKNYYKVFFLFYVNVANNFSNIYYAYADNYIDAQAPTPCVLWCSITHWEYQVGAKHRYR